MKTSQYTHSFEIAYPIAKLFPLFSPEGEKSWVPDWDYINLMGNTALSEDYIFITTSHDHAQADAIWIVSDYQPEKYFIKFYKIEPENKIGTITIACFEVDSVITKTQVSYKYMAISPTGEKFLTNYSESDYTNFIAQWKILLEKYLNITNP